MNKEMAPNDQDPLSEATYFILLCLAPGSKHGYAIMKDVSHLSHGRVTLSTGTLYSALKRLLDLGWIQRVEDLGNGTNGRQRKNYSLTALGHHVLEGEVARLEDLVGAAQLRMLGGKSGELPG